MPTEAIHIDRATVEDAGAIAALHADSWRRNYRGAYSDEFLDGDVLTDREALWSARLSRGDADAATFAARAAGRGGLAGFAHLALGADPQWGCLLDNLHVAHTLKGTGIGTRLMARVAEQACEHDQRLHLYVLEQNSNAQAFYRARGGRFVEASPVSAPGGIAGRLNGTPKRHLYAWDDPSVLLRYG